MYINKKFVILFLSCILIILSCNFVFVGKRSEQINTTQNAYEEILIEEKFSVTNTCPPKSCWDSSINNYNGFIEGFKYKIYTEIGFTNTNSMYIHLSGIDRDYIRDFPTSWVRVELREICFGPDKLIKSMTTKNNTSLRLRVNDLSKDKEYYVVVTKQNDNKYLKNVDLEVTK